jgi:hypothetical protein
MSNDSRAWLLRYLESISRCLFTLLIPIAESCLERRHSGISTFALFLFVDDTIASTTTCLSHAFRKACECLVDTFRIRSKNAQLSSTMSRTHQILAQALCYEPHTTNGLSNSAGCLRTFQRRSYRWSRV